MTTQMKTACLVMVAGVLFFGCAHEATRESDLHSRAVMLAKKYGIVDTHIDLPYRLYEKPVDISIRSSEGDCDLVRAEEGGLLVPFMSIYTSSELEGTGRSKPLADTLIDIVEGIARKWPDRCRIVTSVADVMRYRQSGKILLALGLENGSPLEGNLDNIRYFYDRGVRYITLAHAKWNHLCDAAYDTVRHWNGLSPMGREAVKEMNRLGMMVDVSHLTDSAFYQIIRLSRAPVIASHSSCRHYTPGFERNISDDMIRVLGATGGVVQIAVGSYFITADFNRWGVEYDRVMDEFRQKNNLQSDDSVAVAFARQYRKDHPRPRVTVADVADHIDHAVHLAGTDHVGIGSDFEGVGNLPDGLKDVSEFPNLLEELLKRGYTDEMIGKLCSGNILRVWAAVERVAEEKGPQ